MENRCGKRCASHAYGQTLINMLQVAYPAGSHHRHIDSGRHPSSKLYVVSCFSALAIHTCQLNLARTEGRHFFGPVERVYSGWISSTVSENLPVAGDSFSVDSNNNTLATK